VKENLFINVYLPTVKSQIDLDIISEILLEIDITLSMFPNYNIIWGGDFNMNLLLGNSASLLINKFVCDYNLEVVKSVVS